MGSFYSMSIIHSIIHQVTSGQIRWVLSKSCKFLCYLNYTFTHAYTSRSEITTVEPLDLLDTDVSSEYQTNSHVPVPYVYIFAVCYEHISALKIKRGV